MYIPKTGLFCANYSDHSPPVGHLKWRFRIREISSKMPLISVEEVGRPYAPRDWNIYLHLPYILSHSCRSTIHAFWHIWEEILRKKMTSAEWVQGALSGIVALTLSRCFRWKPLRFSEKKPFSQPYDSWVGWENSMTRHIAVFFGFGKVQYNQNLPRELHFPNHRRACIHISFWECMQIYWRMSSRIYVMSLEFILQSCVWIERLRNRSHDLCSGSFRVLFVVPNLDFVHWAMMFNTHPLYVSS